MAPTSKQQGAVERAFWAIIRQRQEDAEMSDRSLALAAGISRQSVKRYRDGERSATLTECETVALVFGLDMLDALQLALQHARTLRDAALVPPSVQDDFTMAARRPGAEYAKGNPDVELNELDLP